MRFLAAPLFLFVASSLFACNKADKATEGSASAEGSAHISSAVAGMAGKLKGLVGARIGGAVATDGDVGVEVALHEGGKVEALVSDAEAKLVKDDVKLDVTAQLEGGGTEKVALAFVPARGRFEGHCKAGAKLKSGPVDINASIGGKAHSCKLAAAVVAPEPKVGGNVLVAGGYSAELLAKPSGEVRAFVKDSAGADVKADANASFKAIASAKGGAREEIALAFDPPHACFVGKAKAGVELVPGPIEFAVDAKAGAGVGGLANMALNVDASHGGQVVAVGDYSVELVAKGKEISAFVVDASGKAQAAGDLDLKLDVGANAGSNIALKWDAPSLSYKGTLNANVDLDVEPIRVALVASGKAFSGAVASLKAAASVNAAAPTVNAKLDANAGAKLDTNAKLDAKLDAKAAAGAKAKLEADAKAAAAKAASASASLKVTPPKVDVKAGAGAGVQAGAGAKAGGGAKAGFSFGTK